MSEDDLWIGGQSDDLSNLQSARRPRVHSAAATGSRHIGCPLSWFRLVFPIVRGKNELAVALFLYRQRMIHHSRTVVVTNVHLLAELGIDRFAKYRALRRLAEAGIITLKRANKKALRVTFHPQPKRKQPKNL